MKEGMEFRSGREFHLMCLHQLLCGRGVGLGKPQCDPPTSKPEADIGNIQTGESSASAQLEIGSTAYTMAVIQPTLFAGFRIESNSDNEIWLEVNLDSLLKVLKSADNSGESRFYSHIKAGSEVPCWG